MVERILIVITALTLPTLALGQEQVRTRQADLIRGRELLSAQQWDEAAEIYGRWIHDLPRAVDEVWSVHDSKGDAERDRFRFRLLHFLFHHGAHSSIGWNSPSNVILTKGKFYAELAARLPAEERKDALDLSAHMDLLEFTNKELASGRGLPADGFTKVVAAVKGNPRSVPAMAALLCIVERHHGQDRTPTWPEVRDLLTDPWGQRALAGLVQASGRGTEPDVALSILQTGLLHVPGAEDKAQLLHSIAAQQVRAGRIKDGLATAEKVYASHPGTIAAVGARVFAVNTLLEHQGADQALALIRRLQKQDAQRDGLDEALFTVAMHHFDRADFDKCIGVLEEMIVKYANTSMASRAMLGLAESYAAKKDRPKQLEWLKRCAALDKTEPTGRGIMDTDNTRSVAMQRLAMLHEQTGDWKEALHWWKSWEPRSWCGTCAMSMRAERQAHIAACFLKLGDHPAAARFLLQILAAGKEDSRGPSAQFLVRLYADARQIADLEGMVDAIEKNIVEEWIKQEVFKGLPRDEMLRYAPTHPYRELFQIRKLGARKDVKGLIAITQKSGFTSVDTATEQERDWQARAAADELSQCGGAEVAALEKALADGPVNRSWLIYALGKSTSPKALSILLDLAEREMSSETNNVAYAISLHGADGKKALTQIAAREGHSVRNAAQERLKLMSVPAPLQPSAPKAGSLPRNLKEVAAGS